MVSMVRFSNSTTLKAPINADLVSLVSFFDLLAKFDFEDSKKNIKKSVFKTASLASAPKESVLSIDIQQNYGAEKQNK